MPIATEIPALDHGKWVEVVVEVYTKACTYRDRFVLQ
jgi:hypothetical protein